MDEVELYRKHRPQEFKELIGQADALAALNAMGRDKKIPHVLLLSGPAGTGKTTVARILRKKLGCVDADFTDMNAAANNGVDDIRAIQGRMGLAPMSGGKCRIWLIDEAQKLTEAAQQAALKMLEDTPDHVYFILASSQPEKLSKPVRTRCTEIKFKSIAAADLKKLVEETAKKEGKPTVNEVAAKIAELAEGSARKALVLLHQVMGIADVAGQMKALEKADVHASGFEVAQALLKGKDWGNIRGLLKSAEDQDAEGIRRVILGFMKTVLLGGNNDRAYNISLCFKEPTYQWGPGAEWNCLVACCYEAATKI